MQFWTTPIGYYMCSLLTEQTIDLFSYEYIFFRILYNRAYSAMAKARKAMHTKDLERLIVTLETERKSLCAELQSLEVCPLFTITRDKLNISFRN